MKLKEWIIAENEDYIALNKPSGLLSIPDREGKETSLKKQLQEAYGNIFTVHRLDKDTSGLIIFAKTEEAHKHLSRQFEERQTLKIYQGLVTGSLPASEGLIDAPIAEHPVQAGVMVINRKGKPAQTEYTLLADHGLYSLVQFRIFTGRTHQIRIHMKNLGNPIVCDPVYGDGKPVLISSFRRKFKLSKNEEAERPILGRLALHSFQLGFTDQHGQEVLLEATLPKDIRATLQQLEKRKK